MLSCTGKRPPNRLRDHCGYALNGISFIADASKPSSGGISCRYPRVVGMITRTRSITPTRIISPNKMKSPFSLLLLSLLILSAAGCKKDAASEAERMSELHAGDSPVATGMAQEPATDVVTRTVAYGTIDGTELNGYLAEPAENADSLPGVIMIHEWWGLNDNIRTMARRLAGEGYRVLAVDLYDGRVGETPEQAREIMGQALENPTRMETNLVAAYTYLDENLGAPKTGVIGWCFGGGESLAAALRLPNRIDATVIYYGRLVEDREKLATLQMPILGFFGAEDGGIPVEAVHKFQQTLEDLGKSVDITVYEGAGHAFANPSGQNYVEDAANDSWRKTLRFFATNLKG